MEPPYHAVFAVLFTVPILYFFLPSIPVDLALVFFIVASGVLPDFDHRKKIWGAVIFFIFLALFYFLSQVFERSAPGDFPLIYGGSLLIAGFLSWLLYVTEPLRAPDVPSPGSGTVFAFLYALFILAATGGAAYAVVAFIAYSSHWVLDAIAYQTRLGRRFLVGYADWEEPYEHHVRKWRQAKGN